MSEGPDLAQCFLQGNRSVDRSFQGSKAAGLPGEQPARCESTLCMRTANALGIAVPRSSLPQADKVGR